MQTASHASATSLLQHPIFVKHDAVWQPHVKVLRISTFDRDAILFHHGDTAANLWLVLSGWIKLIRQTPDGKETVTRLCTKDDLFGEAALFAHADYPYHAQVISNTAELVLIPAPLIRQLVQQHPQFSADMMALLNERNTHIQLMLEHMTTLSAAQRLGCFLLTLCHGQTQNHTHLQIPVEKNILASYLGMKPETLSRSQQQLRPLGIHINGHHTVIDNISALQKFVCGSCSQSESGLCDSERSC